MKKIVSVITLLAIVVCTLASCAPGVDAVISCYNKSYPQKIVVESQQMFGNDGLSSVTTLIRGTTGDDFTALMTVEETELRSIDEGSGTIIYSPEKTVSTSKHYREGYGVREKDVLGDNVWSEWDDDGVNFFPAKGELGLNLDTSVMTDVQYADNVLSFTVKAGEATKVFGADSDIKSDVHVTITTDGAVVLGVTVEYVVPADAEKGTKEMSVTVKATYSYAKVQLNIVG